jgi:hypothetical protein
VRGGVVGGAGEGSSEQTEGAEQEEESFHDRLASQ